MKNIAQHLTRAFAGLALAALVAAPALVQAQTPITKEEKDEVLTRMTELITRNAFVPGVDFSKWAGYVDKERTEIDDAKDAESFNTAVNKALQQFGFSHIVLMSPQAARARVDRSVIGIGVTIVQEEGGFRVVMTIPDAPATKAGIVPGDLLLEADGKKLETTTQITGQEGTDVSIKLRKEDGTEKTVTLTRTKFSTVRPETLTWANDDTAVIKIYTFDLSYDRKNVEELMEQAAKAKNLIVDLRSNGGGAVVNMTHFLSLLMPPGTPIGSFITKRTVERFVEDTQGDPNDVVAIAKWSPSKLRTMKGRIEPFTGKVAILLNEGSGSASEIAAAALKDNLEAPIVGHPSAGAVLASIMVPLPQGFMLQYPITDYVTLKGLRLEGNGLKPDVEAPTPRYNEKDVAVEKAVSLLKHG
ncbi:MAG: S41 family peptidase [Fimbriimonadaceae bacterium]|nr:PDZ domain-containing protein [Chthonomonadaceae bacterium]MCO5295997.1 S41 family peptidase [Fimbriimonadaceae bacterium]